MDEAFGCHKASTMSSSAPDLGIYRTVCIANTPLNTWVYDLIRQLGSGIITEVKGSGYTSSLKIRHMLVTFLDQDCALHCIQQTIQRLDILRSLQGYQTAISVFEDPLVTYPMPPALRTLVQNGALSRILLLEHVPSSLPHHAIASALAPASVKHHGILAIETIRSSNGHSSLHMHLNSIDNALRCYIKAPTVAHLAGSTVSFLPDPALGALTSSSDERSEAVREWLATREDLRPAPFERVFTPFRTAFAAEDGRACAPAGPRVWVSRQRQTRRVRLPAVDEGSEAWWMTEDEGQVEMPGAKEAAGVLIEGLDVVEERDVLCGAVVENLMDDCLGSREEEMLEEGVGEEVGGREDGKGEMEHVMEDNQDLEASSGEDLDEVMEDE